MFGAAGSGTTTTASAVANLLNFTHVDVDSYSWTDTEIPKSGRIPHTERIPALQQAISACDGFVMSGSICGWGDILIPQFDFAVFMTASTDVRLKRLQKREHGQFGVRIAEGGDMFTQYKWFIDYASSYDTGSPPDRCRKLHEQWIESLPCPVLRIDGTRSIDDLAAEIMAEYSKIEKVRCAK